MAQCSWEVLFDQIKLWFHSLRIHKSYKRGTSIHIFHKNWRLILSYCSPPYLVFIFLIWLPVFIMLKTSMFACANLTILVFPSNTKQHDFTKKTNYFISSHRKMSIKLTLRKKQVIYSNFLVKRVWLHHGFNIFPSCSITLLGHGTSKLQFGCKVHSCPFFNCTSQAG